MYIYVYICIYIYISWPKMHMTTCTVHRIDFNLHRQVKVLTTSQHTAIHCNTLQHTATHVWNFTDVFILDCASSPALFFHFYNSKPFQTPYFLGQFIGMVRGGTKVLHCALRVFVSSNSVDFCCTCTVCALMDVHVSFSLLLQHLRHRYTAQWQCGKSRGAIR